MIICLGRPSPTASSSLPAAQTVRAAPRRLFGLAPIGGYRAPSLALGAVGSYPTVSPLPDPLDSRLRAHSGPSAVCSLLPCPSPRGAQVLPGDLPCGARTFLDPSLALQTAIIAFCPEGKLTEAAGCWLLAAPPAESTLRLLGRWIPPRRSQQPAASSQ
jgi:hypothetical protein